LTSPIRKVFSRYARQRFPQWIRSRFGSGAPILLYHRVADVHDPLGMCVTPADFERQLCTLKATHDIVSLNDLVEALFARRAIRGLAAVTFDDGYADNLYEALPILEALSIPATIFIATGTEPFWWDRLLSAAAALPDIEDVWRNLLNLGDDERNRILTNLENDSAARSPLPQRVTSAELRQLSGNKWITIGAHTVSHPMLAHLPRDAQRREIVDGKRQLEEITGTTVRLFAYPFGTPQSIDAVTTEIVRESGFTSAFTTTPDLVGASSNRFLLPRIGMPRRPYA